VDRRDAQMAENQTSTLASGWRPQPRRARLLASEPREILDKKSCNSWLASGQNNNVTSKTGTKTQTRSKELREEWERIRWQGMKW